MMIHMYLFYSFVYSTVEGWQESGEKDDRLKQLLSETNKLDKLRRFRNAVFHVQKEFISPKTISFLDEKDTEHWIREVHFALGKALENHPDIKPYFEMGKKLF